jgi:hypothetical protein
MLLAVAAAIVVFVVGCDYTKKHDESLAKVESPGISGHNVTIRYKLVGREITGIGVWYSLDGRYWYPATQGWGGESVVGLTATVAGVDHVWSWDSLADVGPALSLNAMIKIVPWGREKGFADTSPVFIVNNTDNTGPTSIILSDWNPATRESGNIIVECGIADCERDAVTAVLQFSIDGGTNFYDARLADNAGGDPSSKMESAYPTESNDGGDQLSLWNFKGLDLSTNTDAAGKLYVELADSGGTRTVSVYDDSGKSSLVAEGSLAGNGNVMLAEQNSSGLSGSVYVAYTGNDTDIELACFTTHYLVWDTLNDIGANYQPDVSLRIKALDSEAVGATPSYTPDTSPEKQLSVDNTVGLFINDSIHIPAFWSGSRDAVTADFDNDGDTDIFVGNLAENFCYTNSAGIFSMYGQIVHDDTREVISADFNNDTFPDVFAANKGWNIIYLSNGTQRLFSPMIVGICEETRGAACRDPGGNTVDFDHNGEPDIFVCNLPANTVYLNPGTANFSILYAGVYKDDCRGAAIADFDGDGELDVFCCCRFQDRLLLGDGTGNFTVAADALPGDLSTSWRAVAFDLENDGDWDLFVGNWGQNVIAVNQGNAQGGTEGVFHYAQGILPVHVNNTRSVGTFVRNGITYLVTGNTDDYSRLYRIYKGRAFDVTPVNFPVERTFTYGVHVATGANDIDGDGLTDIYVANRGKNALLLGQ